MIDTHSHIQLPEFDSDRSEVLARAEAAGVTDLLVVGADADMNKKALWFAENFPKLHAAIGIHPENAKDYDDAYELKLASALKNHKAVALGEIGLDYHWKETEPALQREVFARQLALAQELSVPIIVHSRDAAEDTLAVLKDFPKLRGQIHCFAYDSKIASRFLERGFYLSFCGPITFKNGKDARETSLLVPLERLLCETDCPYMAPVPYRGRRNEPAFVCEIAKAHAKLRNLSYEEVDKAVSQNARDLFLL